MMPYPQLSRTTTQWFSDTGLPARRPSCPRSTPERMSGVAGRAVGKMVKHLKIQRSDHLRIKKHMVCLGCFEDFGRCLKIFQGDPPFLEDSNPSESPGGFTRQQLHP